MTAEDVLVPGSGAKPKYAHPGSFKGKTPVAEAAIQDAEYTDVATASAKGGAVAATPEKEESAVRRRRKGKKRR
jgi:hypothetical protein